jgi:hypothetical protein
VEGGLLTTQAVIATTSATTRAPQGLTTVLYSKRSANNAQKARINPKKVVEFAFLAQQVTLQMLRVLQMRVLAQSVRVEKSNQSCFGKEPTRPFMPAKMLMRDCTCPVIDKSLRVTGGVS